MEINQMKYFCEICKSSSMSKAAEKLHMSQQGLSIAIRRLENELNCDLFYRKPSGLVLTEQGKFFKEEAENILKRVDRIYDFCTGGSSTKRVSLACTTNILTRLPVALQSILLEGNDEFQIDMCETWTVSCEELVQNETVTFGIIYGDCDASLFNIKHLDTLKQAFIVNREHPFAEYDSISLSQMDALPLIVPPDRCRPGQQIRKLFKKAGAQLNVNFECDRPKQVIDIVASNPKLIGRVIEPDVTVLDEAKVKILRLEDDEFLLPICLVSKKGKKLTTNEKMFQYAVADCFK